MQLGLKEEGIGQIQLQSVIACREVALFCYFWVDEGEGVEDGG